MNSVYYDIDDVTTKGAFRHLMLRCLECKSDDVCIPNISHSIKNWSFAKKKKIINFRKCNSSIWAQNTKKMIKKMCLKPWRPFLKRHWPYSCNFTFFKTLISSLISSSSSSVTFITLMAASCPVFVWLPWKYQIQWSEDNQWMISGRWIYSDRDFFLLFYSQISAVSLT